MDIAPTALPGVFLIQPQVRADDRGCFVKTFHAPTFVAHGLRTDWREQFYSSSQRNVVRGMHFQLPPAEHTKLVFCVAGSVLDLVVDLRCGSPTQNQYISAELSAENGVGLYIPSGCAHGFLSLSDSSTVNYNVTSVHAADQDAGIAWDSFGFAWPVTEPIVSARDRSHPALEAFDSPFRFDLENPAR